MLAGITADRFVRRAVTLFALAVLFASPPRAETLRESSRHSARARPHSFARHFARGRKIAPASQTAAGKPRRTGPARSIRIRRRRNGAEHARHVAADGHTR